MRSPDRDTEFLQLLWQYYDTQARELPWRAPAGDGEYSAYQILVSELMLQQTQVSRVIPKYQACIRSFPDIISLAQAPLGSVLRLWSGLGYNRRAKYLHDACQRLATKAEPWTTEDLVSCKGIGVNTAAAVRVYAYNQLELFIETNVRTVYIHHYFSGQEAVTDKEIMPHVSRTIDRDNPREFYWALMDYGSHLKRTGSNAVQKSTTYKKQSSFTGSRRFVRGAVLRHLTKHGSLSLNELEELINDSRLDGVLSDLCSEGIIQQNDSVFSV